MADQPTTPRTVPIEIQREVRQRCGFGCVLCGTPLYHYDHIYGFDDSKPHAANEITLLCARHHDEKTRGLLPIDQVVSANSEPKNVSEGVTAPYGLHLEGSSAKATIGGNVFAMEDHGDGAVMYPIVIDDQPIVSFVTYDRMLFLDAVLFDAANNPVLVIKRNEIRFSTELPDVEFTGKKSGGGRLIVRSGNGVFIYLEFEPPDRIGIPAGVLLCNGVRIELQQTALQINGINATMSGGLFEVASGIVIGTRWPHRAGIRLTAVPRYSVAGASGQQQSTTAHGTHSTNQRPISRSSAVAH